METQPKLVPGTLATLDARRICVVKPSSLGDIVQSLPILPALRNRFPYAQISWISNRVYAPLLEPISLLDQVIRFDRSQFGGNWWTGLQSWRQFSRELADQRFDLVLDLQGLLRTGLMCWASGASTRVGLRSSREGACLFHNLILDDGPLETNAIDRYWTIVKALGMGNFPRSYPLELSAEERAWATAKLSALPRPLLAINAGARWVTKRWPADRFADAANSALADVRGSVVLLGAPGEEAIANEVNSQLKRPALNLCGKTKLRQLAAVLESCDALLTNDTGPMHLAAAVDCPTVSIFTCTSPQRAAPVGEQHKVVQTCVACKASYLKTCSRMDCMRDLTTERVLESLRASIASVQESSGRRELAGLASRRCA